MPAPRLGFTARLSRPRSVAFALLTSDLGIRPFPVRLTPRRGRGNMGLAGAAAVGPGVPAARWRVGGRGLPGLKANSEAVRRRPPSPGRSAGAEGQKAMHTHRVKVAA